MARYTSVRSLLARANVQDLEIHQMDVKTAFLTVHWIVKFTCHNQKDLLMQTDQIMSVN